MIFTSAVMSLVTASRSGIGAVMSLVNAPTNGLHAVKNVVRPPRMLPAALMSLVTCLTSVPAAVVSLVTFAMSIAGAVMNRTKPVKMASASATVRATPIATRGDASSHATGAREATMGGARDRMSTRNAAETAPAPVDEARLRAHKARVASSPVRTAIDNVLRRRVPEQDVGALTSDVLFDLLQMADPPVDDERCKAAAIDIAFKKAATHIERLARERHRSRDLPAVAADPDGPDEDERRAAELAAETDAMPLAPAYVVHEEKHQLVETALADGTVREHIADVMKMQAEGATIDAIAAAKKVAPSTVRHWLAEGRKDVRAAWQKRAAALGLLVVVALFTLLALERERVAEWLRPTPPMLPDLAPPAPPVTPEMRAAELRMRAKGECDAELYIPCATHLDEAKELDPAGDTSPEVRAMRDAIRGPVPPPLPDEPPLDGKKPPRNPRLK